MPFLKFERVTGIFCERKFDGSSGLIHLVQPGTSCYIRGMKTFLLLIFMLPLLASCKTELPDRSTPKSAFARLSPCIDAADTGCVFYELDVDTRNTVSSIYRILKEMRQAVENSYPEDDQLRNTVYGNWLKESAARSDTEMFDLLCRREHCLKQLAMGFGAITGMKESGNTATVTTVRNKSFVLRKSKGQWGIVLLSEALDGEQIRLTSSLEQVKRNAREYEQQRLATGSNTLRKDKI